MISVIIPAHNEAAAIGDCLGGLLRNAVPDEFDVVVVANACTDATVANASRWRQARVLEVAKPGKANALNVGDGMARGFPRVYLDADIKLDAASVRGLAAALSTGPSGGPLAVGPRRFVDTQGASILVRGYFAIHSRLPAFADGLFGRGVVALSAEGRERFGCFPDVIADDLFLDSQFRPSEKHVAANVVVVVRSPHTTRALLRRLVRVRRGNADLRATASRPGDDVVRPADRTAWLRLVFRNPRLAPAGVTYALLTLLAAGLARRRTVSWGQDASSRVSRSNWSISD